ncbi:MAG: hypothetical protein NTY20_02700 [Candidatus Aenigmarchaeota archaeon]|nr:hypothetical protein [Candidatus Aenigmarchaeota archaeon]
MSYINPALNKYLLDVPFENLIYRAVIAIDESGGKIEKQELKQFLIGDVRALRMGIPPKKYPEMTMPQAHEVAQELLCQHFLTFSEENPCPEKELYFEPTQKAREIRF